MTHWLGIRSWILELVSDSDWYSDTRDLNTSLTVIPRNLQQLLTVLQGDKHNATKLSIHFFEGTILLTITVLSFFAWDVNRCFIYDLITGTAPTCGGNGVLHPDICECVCTTGYKLNETLGVCIGKYLCLFKESGHYW